MHPREYKRLREASGLPRASEQLWEVLGPRSPDRVRPQSPRAQPEPVEIIEPPSDGFVLLPPKTAAAVVGLSLPAFWTQVRDARLPAPLYPSPRSPKWVLAELREALLKTRCLPRDAMAVRRQARLTSMPKSKGKK
jgi:predicted DNA-binding transcriptional regulator AlpA